jgi:hypothetical protein
LEIPAYNPLESYLLMLRKEEKNNCHSLTFLEGIQKNGCPTKAFGHDNLILLGAVSAVRNMSYLYCFFK